MFFFFREKVAPIKPYSDEDILTGDLSILGKMNFILHQPLNE